MSSPGRVVLHVGAMKSGTTYLQAVCFRNRDTLAEQGVLLPGDNWPAQVHAVQDVLDFGLHGHVADEVRGAWQRGVDQIHAWQGHTALISMEFLCYADEDQIARIVSSLDPWEVHVVLTARDLQRTVPAAWQDRMRNAVDTPWPEFHRALRSGDEADEAAASFWREQDLTDILRRWEAAVPRERITVVTVPPRGAAREELLQRFCRTIGVDPALLDPEVPPRNESVGLATANLLQRLNREARGVVPWPVYNRVVKNYLIPGVLAAHDSSPRLRLGPEDQAWVRPLAQRLVRDLGDAGYPVVGDLAELLPEESLEPAPLLEHVTTQELLDLAIRGLVGMLRRYDEDVEVLVRRAQPSSSAAEQDESPGASWGWRSLLDRASSRAPLLMRTRRGVAAFRGRI